MKKFVVVLSLLSCLVAVSARAADVCAYTATNSFGIGCPIHSGASVCLTTPASGTCASALQCTGRIQGFFFCQVGLVLKSGPQKQCPASTIRPTGFNCAPQSIRTPTPKPITPTRTPTLTPGTGSPSFLDEQVFRGSDGTTYEVVSLTSGSTGQVRVTTIGGSAGGLGTCSFTSSMPGQPVSSIVGALAPAQVLHPYGLVRRTALFTPNDDTAIAFSPTASGRLTIGTGAGADNICASAFDCTGQPNVLPLGGLDASSPGVPAACIANGLSASCDLTNIRNAFAFGLASTGSPPVCTDPAAVTVDTTLCAAEPSDGFTVHSGEVIVFVYDQLQGLAFSTGVAGFGVSPGAAAPCPSGGVLDATSRLDATP